MDLSNTYLSISFLIDARKVMCHEPLKFELSGKRYHSSSLMLTIVQHCFIENNSMRHTPIFNILLNTTNLIQLYRY
jgi:hypothetical protein